MDKKYFLGANTPFGFHSYYEHLLPENNSNYVFYIKGGPGTGKSGFMKRISEKIKKAGYTVDQIPCSSDPASLDGITIPKLNTALVDATSPHTLDPKNPAVTGEIINLGSYWEQNKINQHKTEILDCGGKIASCFTRAYNYLGAANHVYKNIEASIALAIKKDDLNIKVNQIISNELGNYELNSKFGKLRRLFASAITPSGLINHLHTLTEDNKVYVLQGGVSAHREFTLEKICTAAIERGINCEAFYCPLAPNEKIEHLIIPSLKLMFTTSNKYHTFNVENPVIIDFDEAIDPEIIKHNKQVASIDIEFYESLLYKAVASLGQAKKLHDELESYYIPYMDFPGVDKLATEISDRILQTE